VPLLSLKAITLYKLKKFEECVACFKKLPKDTLFDSPDFLMYQGTALFEILKYEESIEFFDKILEVKPNDLEVLRFKSIALFFLRKFEECIIYFDKILEVTPNDVSMLFHKASALMVLVKYEEAIIFSDKILGIDPDFSLASDTKRAALEKISGKKVQREYKSCMSCAQSIDIKDKFCRFCGTKDSMLV